MKTSRIDLTTEKSHDTFMAKPKSLKELDVKLQEKLIKIADNNKATIISFVAPHSVRTSPVTFASASIEENEIYRLEKIVKEAVEKKATKNLHFIIHTPGGEMNTTYKIANFLRSKFSNIKAFVPYEAASGGTILCCIANELHIGELGNLTSFDPQVRYKQAWVSAHAFIRAVESIQEEYGEVSPEEMPVPWQQMADKLDPIIYDQMSTAVNTSIMCALRLLEKSGYKPDKALRIAFRLAKNMYTHGFPFFTKDAENIGFTVVDTSSAIMDVYSELVSCRLQEEFPRHAIDVFYPTVTKKRIAKRK